MDLSIDSRIELNNGISIPRLGLGMYQTPDGSAAGHAVLYALEVGYRHIDTAMMYGNEDSVGRAVRHFVEVEVAVAGKSLQSAVR